MVERFNLSRKRVPPGINIEPDSPGTIIISYQLEEIKMETKEEMSGGGEFP
jgi:hypothetical protein